MTRYRVTQLCSSTETKAFRVEYWSKFWHRWRVLQLYGLDYGGGYNYPAEFKTLADACQCKRNHEQADRDKLARDLDLWAVVCCDDSR